MAQPAYDRQPDQISEIKAEARDEVNRAAGQVEGVANRVADQGREVSESFENIARNFKGALDSSVKEQPVATLATAAIVGFLLGALWKS
jgi:ElaB/YqjD/DUF883 family membrane-anchored ribosome-binding protein